MNNRSVLSYFLPLLFLATAVCAQDDKATSTDTEPPTFITTFPTSVPSNPANPLSNLPPLGHPLAPSASKSQLRNDHHSQRSRHCQTRSRHLPLRHRKPSRALPRRQLPGQHGRRTLRPEARRRHFCLTAYNGIRHFTVDFNKCKDQVLTCGILVSTLRAFHGRN